MKASTETVTAELDITPEPPQLPAEQKPAQPSALALMGSRLGVASKKLYATLKDTVFRDATECELIALVVVANEYGLNPLTREIFGMRQKKSGGIIPVVSVDGWNRIANQHPQMDGFDLVVSDDGSQCTCTIYRKDRARPVVVTEYLSECRMDTGPWNSMPRRMLRHKAFIQGARMAFGFAGIYDPDEAERIASPPPESRAAAVPYDPFPKGGAIDAEYEVESQEVEEDAQ